MAQSLGFTWLEERAAAHGKENWGGKLILDQLDLFTGLFIHILFINFTFWGCLVHLYVRICLLTALNERTKREKTGRIRRLVRMVWDEQIFPESWEPKFEIDCPFRSLWNKNGGLWQVGDYLTSFCGALEKIRRHLNRIARSLSDRTVDSTFALSGKVCKSSRWLQLLLLLLLLAYGMRWWVTVSVTMYCTIEVGWSPLLCSVTQWGVSRRCV